MTEQRRSWGLFWIGVVIVLFAIGTTLRMVA